MGKYTELANAVLAQVGGRENINSLYHCMTRLRFKLKNYDAVDMEAVKGIKGVLGAQNRENELQVVIGPAVANVCAEICGIAGIKEGEAVEENLDAAVTKASATEGAGESNNPAGAEGEAGGKKFSFKNAGDAFVGAVSACVSPLVPLFIVIGLANVIAALIGPGMLNLVAEDSHIYTNFYWMGQALLYALPVLAAASSSRHFKAETMISIALACIMLYPDLIAALGAEGGYTVYGIPAQNVAYNGTIIPIILVVWVQSYVEKFLKKVVPDVIKVLLVPFGTIAIMMPLALCLLGPLGNMIGVVLTKMVLALYEIAGPVETALIGAFIPFLTAFGIGRPLFFVCLTVLTSVGVEYSYMPFAMVLANFTVMGCCVGYIIKTKSPEMRQVGITSFIANLLGGVSEPTLFGIVLPNKRTYLPLIIGGAVSGLYMGIMKVGYYQFGPSNFLSVLGFISQDNAGNFMKGTIGAVIGFAATLIAMLLLYKEEKE